MRFSDWPISIHKLGIYFHRVLSDPDSDVLCSEECQTKELLVCCKMFAFFKAIFNFVPQKNCSNIFFLNEKVDNSLFFLKIKYLL